MARPWCIPGISEEKRQILRQRQPLPTNSCLSPIPRGPVSWDTMEFPPIYPKLSDVEMDNDYPYEIVEHCPKLLDWLLCKQVPSDYDKAYSYFTYLGQNARLLSGDALRALQEKRDFFGKLHFKLGGYRMCVSSIATTCDDHFCNDEILHGIMSWLQYQYPSSYNNVTIFDSFLLLKYADKKMKTHDQIGTYNYSYNSVRSWFRKRT